MAEKNCSGHHRKLDAEFVIAQKELEAAENEVCDTRHETSNTENRTAAINQRKSPKNVLDTSSRKQNVSGNEPDAKAILPEPRSVINQIPISYRRKFFW